MTIQSESIKAGPFDGNDSTTVFPFTFKVFQAADLGVILTDISEIESTLVLDADYSVSLNADQEASPGGSVTYPIAGSPLATGEKLTLLNAVDFLQGTDLQNGGAWNPETVENAMDRLTMLAQRLDEENDRGLRVPVSDDVTELTIPTKDNRASKFLAFDVDGEPMASEGSGTPTSTFMATVNDDESAAEACNTLSAVFYVDTVADMKLQSLAAGAVVSTQGYYAAGDGGGATYLTVAPQAFDGYGDHELANGNIAVLQTLSVVFADQFGVKGDGVTDDTLAQRAASQRAHDEDKQLWLGYGKTYLINTWTLNSANCPTGVEANGSTIKASVLATNNTLFIDIIQGTRQTGFFIRNLTVDANNISTDALRIQGMQSAEISNLLCINATAHGFVLAGDPGYGNYYNTFTNIRSGINGSPNGGKGFHIYTVSGGSNYVANNNFIGCQAQYNLGDGWTIDWASNTYTGCSSEINNGYGFNVDNTFSSTFIGGYSENNHQDKAGGGAGDATADESFNLTANSLGVKVVGGRHIGLVSGTTTGQSNVFMLDNYTNPGTRFKLEDNGDIDCGDVSIVTGSGLGVGGANPVAGMVGIQADFGIIAGGSNAMLFNTTDIRALKPIRVQDFNSRLYAGNGSPEGVVTATRGSLYLNNTGGAGTSFYVKESGTGNTGWIGK